jgi:hypothetical protein
VSPKISLQEKEIYSLDGAHKWEQLLQFVLKSLLLQLRNTVVTPTKSIADKTF